MMTSLKKLTNDDVTRVENIWPMTMLLELCFPTLSDMNRGSRSHNDKIQFLSLQNSLKVSSFGLHHNQKFVCKDKGFFFFYLIVFYFIFFFFLKPENFAQHWKRDGVSLLNCCGCDSGQEKKINTIYTLYFLDKSCLFYFIYIWFIRLLVRLTTKQLLKQKYYAKIGLVSVLYMCRNPPLNPTPTRKLFLERKITKLYFRKWKSAIINGSWFCPQKVQLKSPAPLLELADCYSW